VDQELSQTSRFLFRKEVTAWQSLDAEVVIVQLEREEVHVTNTLGAFLMEALKEGATLGQLVARVTDAYDVEEARAQSDVEAFLRTSLEAGLIAEEPAK
jgi:hypothetical protein